MERLRLVIAEDEKVVRQALARMSESLGHEVVAEAANGREAIEMVSLSNPDLVLLDIRMPELNGLEAARVMLQGHCLPIVIVSGHAEQELIEDAAQAGVFGYLIKPITRERLAAAISTAQARFGEIKALRTEVVGLKQSLDDRKLIERAKGIVMRDLKVGEQEAYRWLKRTSSVTNQKIADVARRIVALDASPHRCLRT